MIAGYYSQVSLWTLCTAARCPLLRFFPSRLSGSRLHTKSALTLTASNGWDRVEAVCS
jgi:hypothetical protein